jgi:hypothetical protein
VFAQIARQDVVAARAVDSVIVQSGIAWWARGHRLNVKAGIGPVFREGSLTRMQVAVQTQVFAF